jgi:hypothetical protein
MQRFTCLQGHALRVVIVAFFFCFWSAGAAPFDLTLVRSRTAKTLSVEKRYFPEDDCAVVEGCIGAPGWRTLLRFDVAVANVGRGDLKLGSPGEKPYLYEWSDCHGHYHYRNLINYLIYNTSGRLVTRGAKQAFCLRDNYKYIRTAPDSHGYDCENQGLTAGWEDVYDKSLDCQWIDITGLKPGAYILKAFVNRNHKLREQNYRNNSFTLHIFIPRNIATADESDTHIH